MKKSIIASLLFIFVFCVDGYSGYHPKENLSTDDICNNKRSPDFWKGLSMIPIQFVKKEDDDHLIGLFISETTVEQMKFILPAINPKRAFFESSGGWENEISRRQFLKKFKEDLWLVAYLADRGNIICEAHQVKNWESLRVSYAHEQDNILSDINTKKFWLNMKVMPVFFDKILANQAHWFFLVPANELPKDYVSEGDVLSEENDARAHSSFKARDGIVFKALDKGIFIISKDSVFHTLELKKSRQILKIIVTKTKIRAKSISQDYFVENFNKSFWMCYYDKDTNKILHMTELPGSDSRQEI